MAAVLALVDLQEDFLNRILETERSALVISAAQLCREARRMGVPLVHIQTIVTPGGPRMPHWIRNGISMCAEGTEGARPPAALEPSIDEPVLAKVFFSGFSNPELEPALRRLGCSTLVLAGVNLHACVRETALDAYERGFEVVIAEEATGSYDPIHAALSRDWLEGRAARFLDNAAVLALLEGREPEREIVHRSPWGDERVRWRSAVAGPAECGDAVQRARPLPGGFAARKQALERLAAAIEGAREELVERLAVDIGKPVRYGAAEVDRAVKLVRAAANPGTGDLDLPEAAVRRRPIGTIAVVTAFNNPIAVPLGKIVPALLFGNAVVWKPAPAGSAVAARLAELAARSGLGDAAGGPLQVVYGDASTAAALASDPGIDAVTLTGGEAAGRRLQAICARRSIPFQGELGGNNAAIVWGDSDLPRAAELIAEGAFGCAGQRCTANRRVVVRTERADELVQHLLKSAEQLKLGSPLDPEVSIGPLVSTAARDRVAGAVDRARAAWLIATPGTAEGGAFYAPAIVGMDDPAQELVQEETFGPLLVVQRAQDFDHAMELCNGVRQGLVAALFCNEEVFRGRFLEEAHAGILKINRSTVDAGIEVPFGGWKRSGIGPPEHGRANLEFYTRTQTVYPSPNEA